MNSLFRFAALPIATLLASAAPPPAMIRHPTYQNLILVIPHDSPVKFREWDNEGVANFDGKFELSGAWSYGCAFDCGDPPDEAYFEFGLAPDSAMAARLPHWNNSGDISVVVTDAERLVVVVVEPALRAALRAEKIASARGRVTIVVDKYRTGIACDAPFYSARFVAITKAQKLARADVSGISSCGA